MTCQLCLPNPSDWNAGAIELLSRCFQRRWIKSNVLACSDAFLSFRLNHSKRSYTLQQLLMRKTSCLTKDFSLMCCIFNNSLFNPGITAPCLSWRTSFTFFYINSRSQQASQFINYVLITKQIWLLAYVTYRCDVCPLPHTQTYTIGQCLCDGQH